MARLGHLLVAKRVCEVWGVWRLQGVVVLCWDSKEIIGPEQRLEMA